MNARLYISISQDPNAFGQPNASLAARILAMANQNANQARIIEALQEAAWEVEHDSTEADSIVFHADKNHPTATDAINGARLAGALNHVIDCYQDGLLLGTYDTSLQAGPLAVGQRFALTCDVERFPHFIAPQGAIGTITDVEDDLIALTLDDPLPGCEEWDNALIFTSDDNDPPDPSPRVALDRVTVQLLTVAP